MCVKQEILKDDHSILPINLVLEYNINIYQCTFELLKCKIYVFFLNISLIFWITRRHISISWKYLEYPQLCYHVSILTCESLSFIDWVKNIHYAQDITMLRLKDLFYIYGKLIATYYQKNLNIYIWDIELFFVIYHCLSNVCWRIEHNINKTKWLYSVNSY